MKTIIKTLIFLILSVSFSFAQIIHKNNKYYFADRIIVKFKSDNSLHLNKSANALLNELGIEEIKNTFKHSKSFSVGAKELNKIFTLTFSSPYKLSYVLKKIKTWNNVEWAEPYYLYELADEPNDPDFLNNKQYNLALIKAVEAWNINKGSENIIIAIVDTGVDWDHPDLANNIWINKNEIEGNGIDDDGNGFVDDVRGWDFGGENGTSDNDPNEDQADHGTHVAGIASAVTNNGRGIASIGYNSKIMAVKASQNNLRTKKGTALIAYGFSGIVYAADNGAKVINCSWGGYGFSNADQAAIDYATSKGALVVAAAGNDNKEEPFYPASYKGVLSVAATNQNDERSAFSNYGTGVDVSSPGESIYSTWFDDSYETKSGTSMAAPLVAGLAALVTNEFPDYSPLQVAEQIRINADKIDSLNTGYKYKTGYGRINAFKSLNNKSSESVRVLSYNVYDGNDEIFNPGEELTIEINFINYLAATDNLNITLVAQSSNITIINGSLNAGSISTLQQFDNSGNKFKISVAQNVPPDLSENILLKYSDNNYEDYEWITVEINPSYRTQNNGKISLTVTSKGSLGFDDFPQNKKGKGLKYNGSENLLFEGALMYGTSATTIVNSARNDTSGSADKDFGIVTPFTISVPGNLSDEQGFTIFNDINAASGSLKIETELTTHTFNNSPYNDFIILNYEFNNTTDEAINNFYAGLYFDFDIGKVSNNDYVGFNSEQNFGFVYDNEKPSNPAIGIALLNHDNFGFFAMDMEGTNDSVISYDGFSDLEKWKTLSNGTTFNQAGPSDISVTASAGPFTIPARNKITVAFAVACADSSSLLPGVIQNSKDKYSAIVTNIKNKDYKLPVNIELYQNYPNPFNPVTTIKYSISTPPQPSPYQEEGVREGLFVSLKIYNILGKEVITLVNEKQKPGVYKIEFDATEMSSGIYFYKLKAGNFTKVKKMVYIK